MDYRTILVTLDESDRRAERLRVAMRVAEACGAHLVARFAMSPVLVPAYAMAEAGAMVLEQQVEEMEVAAMRAQREFGAEAARSPSVGAEWRDAKAGSIGELIAAARCADLVVAGQPGHGAPAEMAAAGDLVLAAGRPVLFVPYAGTFARPGRRVLVLWSGSRESARAVADALPLLKRAEFVHVLSFDSGRGTPRQPAPELGVQLARHGVKATLGGERVSDLEIGEQILSRAADLEADLIVMGAYGHSRVRERILGGATRTLLEAMTVPVLMSH